MWNLQRSKLEIYTDIICSLAKKALTIDELAFQCCTSCVTLQKRLEFLLNQKIVTLEIGRDNRAFYVLTLRGVSIFKTFSIVKRLEKLQNHSKSDEQTLQIVSGLTQEDREETQGAC